MPIQLYIDLPIRIHNKGYDSELVPYYYYRYCYCCCCCGYYYYCYCRYHYHNYYYYWFIKIRYNCIGNANQQHSRLQIFTM